tara:strand:- start:454 stop:723 length:270 start_codon:yes stop_codon:yes gene_type:complete
MTEKETLADKEIIEIVYNKVYNTMFELMKQEGYKPLVIAAVMMAQSMRLYRTCLEDNDFNSLVEEVIKTSSEIKPYDFESLEVKNKTIH